MCGIVGLSLTRNSPSAEPIVRAMSDRITHRGPDSDGYLSCSQGLAHVGFRRLAIRDLNPRANQPMVSASGRSAIVFNGEVYNSEELAAKYLFDRQLATSGDTEVVLEILEQQYLEQGRLDVLSELNGMFALAFVDLQSGQVTLVRDRMGKKPLYLYEEVEDENSVVAFASELRSLKPFGLKADPRHAALYFHFGYFPSPYTFYENTTQVCPGEVVVLRQGRIERRFHYHEFTQHTWANDEISLDALNEEFADSIRLRKLSDVPLGAFLSGGIDSGLVAAYLAKLSASQNSSPTPMFTVAFADRAHDESRDAAETAKQLGLPHRVIEIEEGNLEQLAIDYLDCYEQPYADTSGLVTMLLCRAVKEHVTVALSGDGGDEFFGGYARYDWFRKALHAQRFPSFARRVAGTGLSILDRRRGPRLARWLQASDPAALYSEIKRTWNSCPFSDILDSDVASSKDSVAPEDMVRDVFDRTHFANNNSPDPLAQAACFDATYYIPDDLQVKLDRASMQVALEVRCPLLDYRIANLGIQLNSHAKYSEGLKGTLKQLLSRHVPPAILNRPKHGFNVPLARWLQGPMQQCVVDHLTSKRIQESGWLNAQKMSAIWSEFSEGKTQHALSIWMAFNLSKHLQTEQASPLFRSVFASRSQRAA